jgi:outer membrane lipoprotein-sorting protein
VKRALAAAAFTFLACVAAAGSPARADATNPTASALVGDMMERNAALASYRARVHVNVRMLNFPFLSPQLDGTTYYKAPDKYEVVFDSVPSYAKGFSKLFNDVDDPGTWEQDQIVSMDPPAVLDGRPVYVLRLTKKIHSDILDHTSVYVDRSTLELLRMEWYYTSGGKIVMDQQFRNEGGYLVVSSQHATIAIPHVRAVADSTYGNYQTGVAVDDEVFTKP